MASIGVGIGNATETQIVAALTRAARMIRDAFEFNQDRLLEYLRDESIAAASTSEISPGGAYPTVEFKLPLFDQPWYLTVFVIRPGESEIRKRIAEWYEDEFQGEINRAISSLRSIGIVG